MKQVHTAGYFRTLAPTNLERLARARADLRMGVPVILTKGSDAILAAAVETLDNERRADILALGTATLAITARRAETLKARAYDGDIARLRIEHSEPLSWMRAITDPADDLRTPMKGPFVSERDGSADLHRAAIKLIKGARLLPAALITGLPDGPAFAAKHGLGIVEASVQTESPHLEQVVSARVPLSVSPKGRLHIFRPVDGSEEHYAIEIGSPDRSQPVLSRLHSACFTGDLLGSLKCDCGPQLRASLAQMGHEGHGVLLYLDQEGRGIGLANKMRAYSLQDQGFDTVEANHRLGFEDDERDFRLGATILRSLGFSATRLMTNNPAKVAMMERCDLTVTERVPLKVGLTRENAAYLATKAQKSGHLL